MKVYPARCESKYYDVTYRYRLRWNDVIYKPGELKAVAYKNGATIGESVMRTAGPPASIRLTPDRTELMPTGEDFFILVEAVDAEGNVVPLANDMLTFRVSGGENLPQSTMETSDRSILFKTTATLCSMARRYSSCEQRKAHRADPGERPLGRNGARDGVG